MLLEAVDYVAGTQAGLITAAQLDEIGVPRSTLKGRIRTGGLWQRILPGIYLVMPGQLTPVQRDRAALLFAGPTAMLTGASALRHHGFRYLPEEAAIHVLISHDRHRKSAGFVSIERTQTLPRPISINQLDVAPVTRAVVDAARRVTTNRTTRAFTLEAVQRGLASPRAVEEELRSAQRRGTALIRGVIAEAKAGVRSAPEAELRQAVTSTNLPTPLWNPGVFLPSGKFLAQPDGLIEESMVAVEMDSREYHSEGDGWADTLERGTDMSNAGLVVVHVIPGRFRADPDATLTRIKCAHDQGLKRPRPDLRVVPCEEFERIKAGWMQRWFGERA
jgi:hypothetical protein